MKKMTFQEKALREGEDIRNGLEPRWWQDKNPYAGYRSACFNALLRGDFAMLDRMKAEKKKSIHRVRYQRPSPFWVIAKGQASRII